MKKKSPSKAGIWDVCQSIPWYGLSLVVRVKLPGGGSFYELSRDSFTCLGPDLINGFLDEHRRYPFDKGFYSVGIWYPKSNQPGLDWGTLSVRGPGSWCLRSRDGQTVYAPGRRGLVFQLRGGAS